MAVGLCLVLSASILLLAAQPKSNMPTLVRLEEVNPGGMLTEETCTIVYIDSTYHSERTVRRSGERPTSNVFEGALSTAEMNKLIRIVKSDAFLELKPPLTQSRRSVMEDFHLVRVTVPRASGIQDLQYPTADSRKGTEKTLGPLLGWWKGLRKHLPPALEHGASNQCLPSSVATADGAPSY